MRLGVCGPLPRVMSPATTRVRQRLEPVGAPLLTQALGKGLRGVALHLCAEE